MKFRLLPPQPKIKGVKYMICKICNKYFKNEISLKLHIKIHNITVLNYYIQYENFVIPKCINCGKDVKNHFGLSFYKTCGDKECIGENKKDIPEVIKEKIKKRRGKSVI